VQAQMRFHQLMSDSQPFETLEDAISWYEQYAGPSEYGLRIKLDDSSEEKHSEQKVYTIT